MSMSDERKTQEERTPDPSTGASQETDPASLDEATLDAAPPSPAADSAPGDAEAGENAETSEPETAPKPESRETRPAAPAARESGTSDDVGQTSRPAPSGVYFYPDRVVSESEVRRMLASGTRSERAEAVSRLLTYAEYDEIWSWVDRDAVRDLFDDLDLPERLRSAWARNLGLVARSS